MSEEGSQAEKSNQEVMQPKDSPQLQDQPQALKSRKPERQCQVKAKKKRKMLSFEEEEDEEQVDPVPKIKKNTNIKNQQGDKSLANSDNLEQKLKEQFYAESERLKEELIELEFSYWDGANVVKTIRRKKNTTVKEFLEVCRLELVENNQNIASVQARDLLFVIKDFIAPHKFTLADIELLKLKTTKNDLLLNLRNVKFKKDGRELTLSINLDGPVRIVERARYEKNKASYPFCNWHTLRLG